MQDAIYLRILFGTLLTTLAAAACSGDPSFTEALCTDGRYEPLEGLVLPDDVDYVEYRSGDEILYAHGEPCGRARDRIACETALAAANVDAGLLADGFETLRAETCAVYGTEHQAPEPARYLVVNRADQITTVSTLAELRALLGPVDSVKDAALIAHMQGYGFSCAADDAKDGFDATGQVTADGSFDLAVELECLSVPGKVVLRVGQNGDVQVGEYVDDYMDPEWEPSSGCRMGRAPHGLRRARRSRGSLGAYFAEAAHLEAASVVAFEQIERDLLRFGAPLELVRDARTARADEIRHARAMARRARALRAPIEPVRVESEVPLDLFEFARHNAVEGCVNETYGALVAEWQGRHALDPDTAALMATIAVEEAEHAALSWRIAAWAEPRLSAAQRAELRALRAAAVAKLHEAEPRYALEVGAVVGFPPPAAAAALAAALAPFVA